MGTQKRRSSGEGPGRKPSKAKQLLRTFKNIKNAEVKKEYIRVNLIRSFKRALRDILEGRDPRKITYAVYDSTKHIWEIFKELALKYKEEVKTFAPAETNPDTKNQKGKEKKNDGHKSFNDAAVKEMYQSRHIQMLHYLFVHVIFGESLLPVPLLIQRLGINCCEPVSCKNSGDESTSSHAPHSPYRTDFMQTVKDTRVEAINGFCTSATESTEESINEVGTSHTSCHEKWVKLKEFFMSGIFTDLKMGVSIEPPAALPTDAARRSQYVTELISQLDPSSDSEEWVYEVLKSPYPELSNSLT